MKNVTMQNASLFLMALVLDIGPINTDGVEKVCQSHLFALFDQCSYSCYCYANLSLFACYEAYASGGSKERPSNDGRRG